jgi:ubiquinone/menaquinone biosynthesis C-methylase UbiE
LVGLDFNPEAARRAGAKSGALTTGGDANRLPFADASFGALVSMDVLCHRAVAPGLALTEFHRVLKPGGTLVLNLPAFDWLHSAHDIRVHNARRFTSAQARALLERGCAAVQVYTGFIYEGPGLPGRLHRALASADPSRIEKHGD